MFGMKNRSFRGNKFVDLKNVSEDHKLKHSSSCPPSTTGTMTSDLKPCPSPSVQPSQSRHCQRGRREMNLTTKLSKILKNTIFSLFILIINNVENVAAKGGAARAGAGAGSVCIDCGSADTEEEVEASLIIVGIILIIFIVLCSCQFYQRIRWECEGNTGKKPMPYAPYNRDLTYGPHIP